MNKELLMFVMRILHSSFANVCVLKIERTVAVTIVNFFTVSDLFFKDLAS